jgi:cytochrome c-type biogenesis protein CcmE
MYGSAVWRRMMNNKNAAVLIVIAIGTIFAVKMMTKSVVPYVPFNDAIQKSEYVQLMGSVDRKKGIVTDKSGIRFTLTDGTQSMDIMYEAEKPFNMETAEKIVVIGQYDSKALAFRADRILTKCPSKYENSAKKK